MDFFYLPRSTANAAKPGGQNTEDVPEAKPIEHDPKVFGADPSYDDKPYSPQNQIDIYGAKKPVEVVNPFLEIFRPVYKEGPFEYGDKSLGEKNLIFPRFECLWRLANCYCL